MQRQQSPAADSQCRRGGSARRWKCYCSCRVDGEGGGREEQTDEYSGLQQQSGVQGKCRCKDGRKDAAVTIISLEHTYIRMLLPVASLVPSLSGAAQEVTHCQLAPLALPPFIATAHRKSIMHWIHRSCTEAVDRACM